MGSIHSRTDDLYVYLMIDMDGELERRTDIVAIQIDTDGDNAPDIPCGIVWSGTAFYAIVQEMGMDYSHTRGILDVGADALGSKFELRIPRRVLPSPLDQIKIRVSLINNVGKTLYDTTDGFFALTGK